MDIMLERILSLLPRKPDGRFVRGAKKEFAEKLGYSDGQIVSMWESGDSESYKGKLHEIAAKYDVSVEWLQGKTDEKRPTVKDSELDQELAKRISGLTEQERSDVASYIEFLLSKRMTK